MNKDDKEASLQLSACPRVGNIFGGDRSLGPACSNVAHFVYGERKQLYRIYGVPGGALLVQSLQSWKTHRKEAVKTEVVIDALVDPSTENVENIELVAWGGGPHALIAAASSQSVFIYSLQPFFSHSATQSSSQASNTGGIQKQGPAFVRVSSWQIADEPVAIQWTSDGGGLLISDVDRLVTCVRIEVEQQEPKVSPQALSKLSPGVLDRRSLLGINQFTLNAKIETIWTVSCGSVHDLVAPGPTISQPCATAASKCEKRVSMWWRKLEYEAREEHLRHPCWVRGLDWSHTAVDGCTKPALLTVCEDGVVRIWIQVILAPPQMLGAGELKTTNCGEPEPCYCLALTLDPPMPHNIGCSLYAAWINHISCDFMDPRVLWIASVHERRTESDVEASRKLCVYAVDGLPVHSACRSYGGQCSRSFLWGEVELDGTSMPLYNLSAYCFQTHPVPEIVIVEGSWTSSFTMTQSQVSVIHTKENRLADGKLQGNLSKFAYRNFVIDGPMASVRVVAVHPRLDLICTVNVDGCGRIWDVWPVNHLADVEPETPGDHILTVNWMMWDINRHDLLGMLLCGSQSGLRLCSVFIDRSVSPSHHRGIGASVIEAASIQLPDTLNELKGVVQIAGSTNGSETQWIFAWGVPKTGQGAVGCLVRAQVNSEGAASLSVPFPVVDLPLDSNCVVTAVSEFCPQDGLVVVGTSTGDVFVWELDVESGEIKRTNVCSLDSGNAPGVVQIASSSRCSPYIACATELGPEGSEDALWVLQSESFGCSTKFGVEFKALLKSTPANVCWVDGSCSVLAFVVGYQSGSIEVRVRTRKGAWDAVAVYNTGLSITSLSTTSLGLPIIATGTHLLVLSMASDAIHGRYFLGDTVAGCSIVEGGGLTDYHPAQIQTLLTSGLPQTASASITSLTKWLTENGIVSGEQQECFAPTLLGPIAPLDSLLHEGLTTWTCKPWSTDTVEITEQVPYSTPGGLKTASESVNSDMGMQSRERKLPAAGLPPTSARQAEKVQSNAQSTGLLDMSAFGMGMGGGGGGQAPSQSTVESGLLDPNNFGMGGDSSGKAASHSGMATGTLDPSMFGFGANTVEQKKTEQSTAMETGVLDLASFGMGGAAQPSPGPSMESGTLDPNAFGFGSSGQSQEKSASTSQAVESGMLDMSAFGMGGIGGASESQPKQTDSGQSQQKSASTSQAVESGMLDMSAFGMGGIGGPSESQPKQKIASSEPQNVLGPSSSTAQPPNAHSTDKPAVVDTQKREPCILFRKDLLFQTSQSGEETAEGWSEQHMDVLSKALSQNNNANSESDNNGGIGKWLGLERSEASTLQSQASLLGKAMDAEKGLDKGLDAPAGKMLMGVKMAVLNAKHKKQEENGVAGKERNSFLNYGGLGGNGMHTSMSYQSLTSAAAGAAASISALESIASTSGRGGSQRSKTWSSATGLLEGLNSAHILWAIQSTTQTSLIAACLECTKPEQSEKSQADQTAEAFIMGSRKAAANKGPAKMSWEGLKKCGAGFWCMDKVEIARLAEEIAKAQFGEKRDPHKCALLYVAMGKARLLGNLFRGAGHVKVAELLARDFSSERNKQAAAKNAYVLLGKHRYDLAAAFFLVGGHINDALGVCARELGDPQLALFIASLIEGPGGNCRQRVIEKELVPIAESLGDRAAEAMLMWASGHHSKAMQLMTSVNALKQEPPVVFQAENELLLLQFAFDEGLRKLEGRYVPVSLFEQLQCHVGHAVHLLSVCGMPVLALHVFQTAIQLAKLEGCSGITQDALAKWQLRLVTAAMLRHLPAPQAVSARDPSLIMWHQHVQSDLALLETMGIALEDDAVMQHLESIMGRLYDIPTAPLQPQPYIGQPTLKTVKTNPSSLSALETSRSAQDLPELVCEGSHRDVSGMTHLSLDPHDLLHVEGDRCAGVCCSRSAELGAPHPEHPHRVAVAMDKHGIHYVDWGPPVKATGETHSGAHDDASGGVWQALRRHHWPNNRWVASDLNRAASWGSAVVLRELNTGDLVAHPSLNLFLSGGNTGGVHLWRFGENNPCANFHTGFPARSRMAQSWEAAKSVAWNASGDRLAAVGSGGQCAVWRLDSGARTETGGLPDWSLQCAPRSGADIDFVYGSGSMLVVGGVDASGQGIASMWDTLVPKRVSGVSSIPFNTAVTRVAMVPGTLILVSALESGSIQAHDFRMLGEGKAQHLWSLSGVHDGHISSMEVGWAPFGSGSTWELAIATGGRDGDICVLDDLPNQGVLRQRLHKAHWKKSGQLTNLLLSGLKGGLGTVSVPPYGVKRIRPVSASGAAVLDLEWCDEGLVSGGADGVVQLFSWSRGEREGAQA